MRNKETTTQHQQAKFIHHNSSPFVFVRPHLIAVQPRDFLVERLFPLDGGAEISPNTVMEKHYHDNTRNGLTSAPVQFAQPAHEVSNLSSIAPVPSQSVASKFHSKPRRRIQPQRVIDIDAVDEDETKEQNGRDQHRIDATPMADDSAPPPIPFIFNSAFHSEPQPTEEERRASDEAVRKRLATFLNGADMIEKTTPSQRSRMSKDRLLQRNLEIQCQNPAHIRIARWTELSVVVCVY